MTIESINPTLHIGRVARKSADSKTVEVPLIPNDPDMLDAIMVTAYNLLCTIQNDRECVGGYIAIHRAQGQDMVMLSIPVAQGEEDALNLIILGR
ncbi:MAG: hypothetical protein ACREBC_36895, partial [Pyrinomonadaceae bacterium]